MKKFAALAVMVATMAAVAEEKPPTPPTPQKEHGWLKKLEGEWVTEATMTMGPGKVETSKGTETTRILGPFWAVSEYKAECFGVPMTGLMTIGYDAATKKYNGTWVCSMCDLLWKYQGTVDGNVLTLNTEGPNPTTGKTAKMRDVIELKGDDQKTLTSQILGDDGKWVTFMTLTAKRKK